jgi:SAM-dependent methyltransferase
MQRSIRWTARRAARAAYLLARMFGFDAIELGRAIAGVPFYIRDIFRYAAAIPDGHFLLRMLSLRPQLSNRFEQAGVASGHYFHQDLWAARKVFQARPGRHVDVGSRIDGFIAHLLTFMDVDVVDVRPLQSKINGLNFIQGAASDLKRFPTASVESLSSLHAVEHFGLGRYGDEVDPLAWRKAALCFIRVLRPGGRLYLSVPIGIERVEFNSHRVFQTDTIIEAFRDLDLISFSAVDDSGEMHLNAQPERFAAALYGCGLFEFEKPQGPSRHISA